MTDTSPLQVTCTGQANVQVDFDIEALIYTLLKLKSVSRGRFDFSFVDSSKIVELNKAHLDREYITDIITFNLEDDGEDIIGDVYICVEKAKDNAQEYGNTLSDEIKMLIAHGLLHLLGYTDYTDAERDAMFAEQDRILELAQCNS